MVALHEQMAILAESLRQQEFGAEALSPEEIQTAVDSFLTANPPSGIVVTDLDDGYLSI